MDQTWYLGTEMQMFIFTPVMFLPTWWIEKKFGVTYALIYSGSFSILSALNTLILSIIKDWEVVGIPR